MREPPLESNSSLHAFASQRLCAPATLSADLSAALRPRSRGITMDNIAGLIGKRPNVKIMGATEPEAMAKYTNADKVLTF